MKRTFAKSFAAMLAAAVIILSLALLAACGGDSIPSSTTVGLVGSWDWTIAGITTPGYYVFNADGTGNFGVEGMRTEFRWGTRGGVIYMCATVELCGNSCGAPLEMPYSLDGNTLTVTMLGTTYTYTRGN